MRLGLIVVAAAAALALARIDDEGMEEHRIVGVAEAAVIGNSSGIVMRARSNCKIKQVKAYVKCLTKGGEDEGRSCSRFFAKPCPRDELYLGKPKLIEPAKAPIRVRQEPMPAIPRAMPKDQFGRYQTVKLGMAALAADPNRTVQDDEHDKNQQEDYIALKAAVSQQVTETVPDIDVKAAADGHTAKVAKWKEAAEDMEQTLADRAKAGAAFFLTKGEKQAHYHELLAKNREMGEVMWEKSESAALRHAPDYSMGALDVPMKWPCKECDHKYFTEGDLMNMEEWDERDKARKLAEFRESLKAVMD